MKFVEFMSSTAGRALRVLAGIALVVMGVVAGGTGGWALAIVGLVPLAAGALDVCLVAPLLHAPFRGRQLHRT